MGYGTSVLGMIGTDPRHITSQRAASPSQDAEQSFGQLLMKALDEVNGEQQKAMTLTQQMVTDPDTVDVHDVTIALATANLSLSIAKAVVDRVIRAYQEIINVR
jgi:flagellar hook-basal body complex protein FliE